MKQWACTILAGWTMTVATLSSGQTADPVAVAIERMDQRTRSGWAFVRTIEAGDQTLVARHDPRRDNTRHGWMLESVNGQPPDEQALDRFHQQVDQTHERTTDANSPTRIAGLVNLDSLSLASTNSEGKVLYSFAPTLADLPADRQDVMTGTVVYDPAGQSIESLAIRNTGPYSPKFAVKITNFDLQMAFSAVDGHVVPTQMTTRIQGKAYFKAFDEEIQVSFTEYEWMGEQAR